MKLESDPRDENTVAMVIDGEITALPSHDTAAMRAIRRKYSRLVKPASPEFLFRLARKLCQMEAYRWFGYELIRYHPRAFERLDDAAVEAFGRGLDSWWTVDSFARILSGPAWLNARVSDKLVRTWALSKDRWWRRAALVSTVALNVRSEGGSGDASRTLTICRLLAGDQDDMVAKALSWALRALVVHDANAVKAFLKKHDKILATRVKREVNNKIKTGLKNP